MLMEMNPVEKFNKYVSEMAKQAGVPVEQALNLAIVKEYRAWINKELCDDSRRKERIPETV